MDKIDYLDSLDPINCGLADNVCHQDYLLHLHQEIPHKHYYRFDDLDDTNTKQQKPDDALILFGLF